MMKSQRLKRLLKGLSIPEGSRIIGTSELLGHLVARTSKGNFIYHDGQWKAVQQPATQVDAYIEFRKQLYGE